MSALRPDPVDPQRWARYAGAALEHGSAHQAYNSWLSHSNSLGYMLQFQPPPAHVISIGCGPAMFDILLAAYGYAVTSVDSDADVLRTVEHSMKQFGVELELRQADAFDLHEFHGHYDIAFSGGLVEHWNGTKTAELIAEHARCAPRVQVEVPTRYTLMIEKIIPEVIADAHLYKPGEFAAQFRKAGLRVEKIYTVGSVPTRTRRVLENLVPPVLFRRWQRLTGYSMGVGCIASRPGS
ncbi:MAG TPA: class I SAM-dependent methyltransferase [Candidatus Dormibacteraeota bacterium]|nr:class I SAM-dependent methyltransferase [Candidatus Dormibacteraeota bacterium]